MQPASRRPARRRLASAEDPTSPLVALGSVELFRYSALTFNGHRIHYDRDYATGAEDIWDSSFMGR